jgi:hypothetical protein
MTVCLDENQKAGVGGGSKKRLPSLQIRIHHLLPLTMPEAVSETKLLAATTPDASQTQERAHWSSVSGAGHPESFAEPRCELQIVSDPHTAMLSPSWLLSRISVILAVILAGCGARAPSEGPLFGTGVFHPPPKPGASISQTRMCECVACEPRNCCDGPDDDEKPACITYGDSGEDQLCADSIRSCTSRCTREVWRVKDDEDCASKRPASCCHGG